MSVDYVSLFDSCVLRPEKLVMVDAAISIILKHRALYEQVEAKVAVPWYITGCIDYRECTCDVTKHLHNGDFLQHRTVHVPAGRIPAPAQPPFSFVDSAVDALTLAGMKGIGTLPIASWLLRLEEYNGLGYRAHHDNTPYLWDATDKYAAGLYVGDGKFDASAVDGQAGVAAILLRMNDRGIISLLGQSIPVWVNSVKTAIPAFTLRGHSKIAARGLASALGATIVEVDNDPSNITISFKGAQKSFPLAVINGNGYVDAAALVTFLGKTVAYDATAPKLAIS